ncbi:hypothetical protein [Anabaena azotica]|uniref:Glutathione S-transferase n=1 Tax=Anabaena azotica FACHB-119 TaxID=947527 RepID=A0ABR8DCZ6_9NOST|nr:hypothetical protein [Anabaena azotica]MBD2504358.1 hypothetical protein [Anabaena azotica FACHB-119]
MKWIRLFILILGSSILVWLSGNCGNLVVALPPAEDIPEEILRTEIIIDARSPIDGSPLTAAQYAQLQEQLQTSPPRKLDPTIRQNIFLIRIRSLLKQLFPFLNL